MVGTTGWTIQWLHRWEIEKKEEPALSVWRNGMVCIGVVEVVNFGILFCFLSFGAKRKFETTIPVLPKGFESALFTMSCGLDAQNEALRRFGHCFRRLVPGVDGRFVAEAVQREVLRIDEEFQEWGLDFGWGFLVELMDLDRNFDVLGSFSDLFFC